MSEKTLYQTIILPLRKSLNDTHPLISTKISTRIRAVKKRGQRGYKRENGALISFQIAVSFCAKGLSQQNTTKQRMHLKEVVNLHWTLRKGIKIGEKNTCLRTTDFSTFVSSATTVRFSSAVENDLAGICSAIESINLRGSQNFRRTRIHARRD